MGIPGFNSWFYDNNKQAYQPMDQTTVDHLYIDMNSVLHNVLRKAENYDKYHAMLHKRLDAILRLTNPRKSVMLSIDGPAPLAKLVTQRERRKKTFTTEKRKKEHGSSSGSSKRQKQKDKVVSSTALTPGTPFMHDVSVSCIYFICARLANRKWQHLEWELSGPTVAGEGEVKILGRLARPRHELSVGPEDTHLIVGDDADLILMALVSSTPRLYILNAALSDNSLGPKTAVLSVDRLHQVWLQKHIAGPTAAQAAAAATGAQQQQQLPHEVLLQLLGAKADLALLAVLSSGNDYLPVVKYSPKLAELWSSYVKLRQLPQFANRSIITMNSSTAQQREQQQRASGSSSSSIMRELACSAELDVLMLAEVLAVATEGKRYLAQLQQGSSPAAAAVAAQDGDGSLSGDAAEALPWLKGMLWTMSMYFAGDCPDYRWCYQGGSPTAQGLRALAAAATAAMHSSSAGPHTSTDHYKLRLSSFSISCCSDGSSSASSAAAAEWQATIAAAAARLFGDNSRGSVEPLLPHVCSLALLPAGAQEHLPPAVQHLMDSTSPIYDLYATCEGCEAVQQEAYAAQAAYNAILQQIKTLETEMQAVQGQEAAQQQQQDMEALTAAKAAALAVLHAAQGKRKRHEAQEHPGGVDKFDIGSLEAAVAGIPAGDYSGNERALTQLSHSLLFRMDHQVQHQQQYGRPYGQQQYRQYGQQQQQYSTFSSSSHLQGRKFKPPPPPVERFGPAFSRGGGFVPNPIVLRSLIWETAFECQVGDDPDLHLYSNYMVVGTDAAAAAAAIAGSEEAAADGFVEHQRKHAFPQQQAPQGAAAVRDNTAAAAALKAMLRANVVPQQPASKAAKVDSPAAAPIEAASTAAAVEAAALAAHNIGLPPGSKQQQQQGKRGGPNSSDSRGVQHQQGSIGDHAKQPRTRSPSPRSRGRQQQPWQQQQQRRQSPPPGSSSGWSKQEYRYGDAETAAENMADSAICASSVREQYDNGAAADGGGGGSYAAAGSYGAPPAAASVPLPSSLLGRAHNGASASAASAGGSGAYNTYGQNWGYVEQQWQQTSGTAVEQSYNPVYQQYQQQPGAYQYPCSQHQQQQPYQPLQYQQQQYSWPQQQQRYQQPQAVYYQQQQQQVGYNPLQRQQQQLQWPQPLRSVSPNSGQAFNSSSGSYVVPPAVMPPVAAARPMGPPYPGMHL